MVSRTRLLSAIAAAGALTVTTAGGAHAATGWQQEPVPVAAGNILALTRVAPHVSWAAGFQLRQVGKSMVLNPVVLSRDDRDAGNGNDGHSTPGTGQWRQVPTPGDGLATRANALAAHGADDVWVVGDNDVERTGAYGTPIFTEHWDGKAWRTVMVPTGPDVLSANLLGVSVLNQHDAWAVGIEQVVRGGEDQYPSIIEHWDGKAWQQTKLPVDAASLALMSVTATAPDDVWAVGSQNRQPVVLHYDGREWSMTPGLPTPEGGGEFNTVVAKGPHDVWAAGDAGRASGPLVAHYDGRTWTSVPAPGDGEIFAATQTPDGIAFVGNNRETGAPYGQVFNGRTWTDLAIPSQGLYSAQYGVLSEGGKLTVSGAYDTGEGQPKPLMISADVRN
ncbi:MAG: hypothetical protein HOW97_18960 [Catenulispora sp.]|nr:hypothetical protein [Catenulispora sp.]